MSKLLSKITGPKNRNAGIAVIILLIVIIAIAGILYLRPETKDNPLFIALGFIATVVPFLFLMWQQYNSENNSKEHREKQTREIPRQIPAPPKDFTGRIKDIEELLTKFDRGATITGLRGMGGIGKTALALVLAEKLKPRFPDGQLFVNLLGISKNPLKPADVMSHVIRSYLGQGACLPEDENGLRGLYLSVLSGKKALILLDNATDREQIELLLPPSGCALLFTSRNRFAIPGLEEKDLDVLPLEDAKKLLLEIANRIGNRAEELARLCGCLPIALRNAASALAEDKPMNVDEYLNRLNDARKRLELVKASFSLSYGLLTPDMQRLWLTLSVFPSDFDRVGGAAVWEISPDSAIDILSHLVKLSLVEYQEDSERYHLHDLARDFADSRLNAAEKVKAQQRHAAYYMNKLHSANACYALGSEEAIEALRAFDREWINIKTAKLWLESRIDSQIRDPSATDSLDESAKLLSRAFPKSRAYILELRLPSLERIKWFESAIKAAKRIEDKELECFLLINKAFSYDQLDEYDIALDIANESLRLAKKIQSTKGEMNSLNILGVIYKDQKEFTKAIDSHEKSLSIAREINDPWEESNILSNIAVDFRKNDDYDKAIEYNKKSIAVASQIGNLSCKRRALDNLGILYAKKQESYDEAYECYIESLNIARKLGDLRGEGNVRFNMSKLLYKRGDKKGAIENAKIAQKILEICDSPRGKRVQETLAKWQAEES